MRGTRAIALLFFLAAPQAWAQDVRLERVSSGVPWPRGIAVVEGDGGERIVVLARGRHRRSGGVDRALDDRAGTLFEVDPAVAEVVVAGAAPGEAVAANARALAGPPPFNPWDRTTPPLDDVRMDRPYCTLAWDAASRNFIVCAFSGVDAPDGAFRKNATDALLRYDLRTSRWYVVEQHRPEVVPAGALSDVVPNDFYPHHDAATNAAPHGWLNGPDNCAVVGELLYAVAKDNSVLAQYDLAGIRRDPDAPPPASRVVLRDRVTLDGVSTHVEGHSALAARDGWLYVGFRTTSQVIRLRLDARGDLVRPHVAELVARFAPGDDLIDLAFDPAGALHVVTSRTGRVWRVGPPDPARPFEPGAKPPLVDLRALTGDPEARCGNITFDRRGRLYVCGGSYEGRGAIFRVTPGE